MATARLLAPRGTLLQHLMLAKSADIMGDRGFMKFWAHEKAVGRSKDWFADIGASNEKDVDRFISGFPDQERSALIGGDQMGQIDEGTSPRSDMRVAQSDLAATMHEVARNTALMAKSMQAPSKVTLHSVTPTGADTTLQTASAAAAN